MTDHARRSPRRGALLTCLLLVAVCAWAGEEDVPPPPASPLSESAAPASGPGEVSVIISPGEPYPDGQAASEPAPSMTTLLPVPLEPPPVTSLEIMLDWYPSIQHAALLLAREKGLLEQRGLEVTLTTPADPNVPTKLLAAGRVDLALTRQPLLHLLVDRGMPLIRVATLVDTPLGGLILREGLASPAQLAGRRIGYTDEDSRDLLLPTLLRPHGIELREVELRDLNFDLTAAMVAGEVDGVIGTTRLTLPRRLEDEGVSARLWHVEAHGLPTYDGLILVANRDRLTHQRDAFRRLVGALEEAAAWSIEHPDEAWRTLVAAEPALDTPASRDAWTAALMRLTTSPGALDQGRYAALDAFLHKHGHIERHAAVERLAVDLGAP